jgi:four helix bundle protein
MLPSYRELEVWKLGMEVVQEVYRITRAMPSDERFGLTSQARRAAVSIPANIAEGRTQHTVGGYLRHLGIAGGSLAELETHLILVNRLGMLAESVTAPAFAMTGRLGRMLNTLVRRLRIRAERKDVDRLRNRRPPTPDTRHPQPPAASPGS